VEQMARRVVLQGKQFVSRRQASKPTVGYGHKSPGACHARLSDPVGQAQFAPELCKG
jgi:hypothetical protein